jgi:predicted acetyltransferase
VSGFDFHDPGKLVDGDLELVLVETFPGEVQKSYVPGYAFEMRINGGGPNIGEIHLRVGDNELVTRYAGHIGYHVVEEWRGHHYAARACRLILPLARSHGLHTVWITCNPENAASRRTCELVGARYVETVDLPEDTEVYKEGERRKCRYRLDLQPAS